MYMGSEFRTYRWTRSPRGKVFGVATGLAEWKNLPPNATRLIFIVIVLCSQLFGIIPYLIFALILPVQQESDLVKKPAYQNASTYNESETYSRKSNEDLKKEYEELKKKVETMENEMFDKERDWDNRFGETR